MGGMFLAYFLMTIGMMWVGFVGIGEERQREVGEKKAKTDTSFFIQIMQARIPADHVDIQYCTGPCLL